MKLLEYSAPLGAYTALDGTDCLIRGSVRLNDQRCSSFGSWLRPMVVWDSIASLWCKNSVDFKVAVINLSSDNSRR